MSVLKIREWTIGDTFSLSDIAFRAKASWGYDAKFMELCRAELTYNAGQLSKLIVKVGERDGAIVGFSAGDPRSGEIEAMFVAPEEMGTGTGAKLMASVEKALRAVGITQFTVLSDPNAAGFYEWLGYRQCVMRWSRSTSRYLPLLTKTLL